MTRQFERDASVTSAPGDRSSKASCDTDALYTCVNCGAPSQHLYQLYRHFNPPVIKGMCSQVVDKYVEYDLILVLLDALLHKTQAYRHLLCNMQLTFPWKLLMVLILRDTYLIWDELQPTTGHAGSSSNLIQAALESNFYKLLLMTLFDWAVFYCVLLSLAYVRSQRSANKCFNRLRFVLIGLVVSSFGKLLTVVVVVWGGLAHSLLYHFLTHLLVFTSQLTSLTVTCGLGKLEAGSWLVAAYTLQWMCSSVTAHV